VFAKPFKRFSFHYQRDTGLKPGVTRAPLFPEYPGELAGGRIYSRRRKLRIAANYALDQLRLLARIHQKADVSRMVDEWKRKSQSPCVQLRDEVRDHAPGRFVQPGASGKQ